MPNQKKSKLKKILIVEDEKLMVKALEIQLEKSGFQTEVAFNGEDALTALSKEKYDLILLDIIMPKLSGVQVLEQLRAKGDQTPVIVLSNSSGEKDVLRVKSLGIEHYLLKSDVKIGEIISIVRDVLHVGGGHLREKHKPQMTFDI